MSRRLFEITRPFTHGYVSDLALEQLGPRMAARLDNGLLVRNLLERRRGWAFDGTTADDTAGTSVGVARVNFQRLAVSRTLVSLYEVLAGPPKQSTIGVHNPSSFYTPVLNTYSHLSGANGPIYLPRCMYRDELILCEQSGTLPLVRYGGSVGEILTNATTSTHKFNAIGERRVVWSGGSAFSVDTRAAFAKLYNFLTLPTPPPVLTPRISKAVSGTREYTLEHVKASTALVLNASVQIFAAGWAAPCTPFYNEGTITFASNTLTGQGTRWNTGNYSVISASHALGDQTDGFVVLPGVGVETYLVDTGDLSSDTSLTNMAHPNVSTPSAYQFLRRMPYKDACVFRQCFMGIGVFGRDSTLWYSAPGHDIGFPPKYLSSDFDPSVAIASTNPEVDFMTEFVEVPTSLDADPLVALLATDQALYTPKRGSLYQVTGDYPNFRSDRISDDAGCLDIRSAIVDEFGPFWGGDGGVWTIRSGRPFNLCGEGNRPGILTEWRNLMKEGITGPTPGSTSWIACGVAEGHLLVSVRTAAGTERFFTYDLVNERWTGKFTNVLPRFMWSSRVPGEANKCFGVQDLDTRRVVELSPMFRTLAMGSSPGAATDGDATAPLLVAHTGSRVFFPESITREYRLKQLKVAAKAYDTATPSTTIGVSVVYGDQVDAAGADATETLATFDADTSNTVHVREYRPGTRGRRQQLQIAQTDQDADFSTIEVHEISGRVDVFGGER